MPAFEVTWDDIKNGKRHSARECPVALSISRVLQTRVSSYPDNSYYHNQGELLRAKHPDKVRSFIVAFDFDNKSKICPMEFDLEFLPC